MSDAKKFSVEEKIEYYKNQIEDLITAKEITISAMERQISWTKKRLEDLENELNNKKAR